MYILLEMHVDQQDRTLFRFFNMEYLEADGYFILRIIATNAR